MGYGIGSLGNITRDFTESLNQIFGGAGSSPSKMSTILVQNKYGGIHSYDADKWTGNAIKPKIRYGFAIIDQQSIEQAAPGNGIADLVTYYLDIPPQSLSIKDNFATNIQATRGGIIVESEGVVFKDIVIQGTTGIFPGARGGSNVGKANFTDLTKAPSPPAGVSADTGHSLASNVNIVSGYEEFLALRQFFLKYAYDKKESSGNRFLVFINEKDNQNLIVEPLEFVMERNAKSPMTYNYRIALKAIGNLDNVFSGLLISDNVSGLEATLNAIGNVSANLSVGIQQGRAAINATATLFRKTFQAIDQTVNGPLRQVQFALEDLSNGISDTLSLPEILARNFSSTIANIRETAGNLGSSTPSYNAPTTAADQSGATASLNYLTARFSADTRIPMTRAFVANTRNQLQNISNDLADSFNLGDPYYDNLVNRTPTNTPSPIHVVSDDEFLLLGNVQTLSANLNQLLATNSAFQADAEREFDDINAIFSNAGAALKRPSNVKEISIQNGDTLERIAAREFRNPARWPEIVVLNNLKPPYIDSVKADGVKVYGEKLLVSVS